MERLKAELSVEREDERGPPTVRVRLTNEGPEAVELDLVALEAPSLCLEVEDGDGSPVHLPPPPVPGGDRRTLALGERESHTVRYGRFLPAWVPAGTYRVRFRTPRRDPTDSNPVWIRSEWVPVEVPPSEA